MIASPTPSEPALTTMNKRVTIVVALDAKTYPFFLRSLPVWVTLQTELFRCPWVIMFDRNWLGGYDHVGFVARHMARHFGTPSIMVREWPPEPMPPDTYANQRDKMLTSFVMGAPLDVTTPWWIKIDVDALPHDRKPWFDDAWIADEAEHVLVGARWGYTKPPEQMPTLERWADGVVGLREHARLGLVATPGENKLKHPRIASWICLVKTAWSRRVIGYAEQRCPLHRMPVPSQDGFHWYCAARERLPIIRTNWKRRGWGNYSSTRSHGEKVMEMSDRFINTH